MAKMPTVYRVGSLHLSEGVTFNPKLSIYLIKMRKKISFFYCETVHIEPSRNFDYNHLYHLQVYGTSKKSVPEFGGSTPNLGETHEDGKVNNRKHIKHTRVPS